MKIEFVLDPTKLDDKAVRLIVGARDLSGVIVVTLAEDGSLVGYWRDYEAGIHSGGQIAATDEGDREAPKVYRSLKWALARVEKLNRAFERARTSKNPDDLSLDVIQTAHGQYAVRAVLAFWMHPDGEAQPLDRYKKFEHGYGTGQGEKS